MSYAMDLGSRSSLVCLQWSSGGEVELGVEVNILNARKNSSLCRSGLQSKRNGRPDLLVGGGGWRDGEALIVEGGVYDACDHACNICLEAFCDSDSSTATSCKHDLHLRCILEW
uniref:RING-type E3 ubiquitin transferase n=2 Tax=Aegilops tauschii subsp. strangulata TaxID=200361 RepID=A0A453SJE4_AEGTS